MIDPALFRSRVPAPRALFDQVPRLGSRPRFFVPTADGDWSAVTWKGFAEQVRRVGAWLLGLGERKGGCAFELGDRGAVFAHNRVEWMSAALGIQAAGGVMVPIYPASTAAQAGYVARHSDAKVVFVGDAALLERILTSFDDYAEAHALVLLDDEVSPSRVLAKARAAGKPTPSDDDLVHKLVRWSDVMRLGAERLASHPGELDARLAAVSLEHGAVMLYTSGTTGNPKGVPLTHGMVTTNGGDWLECNAPLLDEGMVDLLWLPMSHIFGFGEACLGNTLGFTTYLCDPASALARLPEVRPSVFMSVPAYWEKLAQKALEAPDAEGRARRLAEATGGALRFCLSGGAGLKREVKELFHASGLLVIEGYGLTETSPTLTLNRPHAFRFDSVGKPLPSVELKLADDGEILARGESVFRGYHKDPDATAAAFTPDGWFQTGDVGRFTSDGFLQIIDRKKEILVTAGGKNVPPANIELRFADEPLFSHVVVYGDGKRYLVAGLWPQAEAVAAECERLGVAEADRGAWLERRAAEAVARVNDTLAKFEQVKRFCLFHEPLTVAGGLLTSTLKVRRKKVWEAFARDFEALYEEPGA